MIGLSFYNTQTIEDCCLKTAFFRRVQNICVTMLSLDYNIFVVT